MPADISEATSQKPRRGRPPGYVRQDSAYLFRLHGGRIRTIRGLQNRHYRAGAFMALRGVPGWEARFPWLLGSDPVDGTTWRSPVMSELGRLVDPEEIVAAADDLCRIKPASTKAAVALVREWRGARRSRPSTVRLYLHLHKAVDGYLSEHPDTSLDVVLGALALVSRDFSEAASETEAAEPIERP